MSHFFDLSAKLLSGHEQNFQDYNGKVVLVVNVASQCGFTPQYTGLEELWNKYKEQGFIVLGFPCNQFGSQEPGDSDEIARFCSTEYPVSFPIFSKIEVNGNNTHPVYAFLKNEAKGILGTKDIKWNFTKFLINKNGEVEHRYAPTTEPKSLEKDIEKLLAL